VVARANTLDLSLESAEQCRLNIAQAPLLSLSIRPLAFVLAPGIQATSSSRWFHLAFHVLLGNFAIFMLLRPLNIFPIAPLIRKVLYSDISKCPGLGQKKQNEQERKKERKKESKNGVHEFRTVRKICKIS